MSRSQVGTEPRPRALGGGQGQCWDVAGWAGGRLPEVLGTDPYLCHRGKQWL